MMRAGDILIIIFAAFAVGFSWFMMFNHSEAASVQIVQADATAKNYPAWRDEILTVSGPLGESRIEIHKGKARFLASPCTNKICIRSGWLEHAGEAAACLPNRISLALLGNDARFDAINF